MLNPNLPNVPQSATVVTVSTERPIRLFTTRTKAGPNKESTTKRTRESAVLRLQFQTKTIVSFVEIAPEN